MYSDYLLLNSDRYLTYLLTKITQHDMLSIDIHIHIFICVNTNYNNYIIQIFYVEIMKKKITVITIP